MSNQGITAIFCMSDRMAGGIYDYLEEKGMRAGDDISVASFDDWEGASFFSPKLTTTRLPLNEIGRTSAEILFQIIEEENSVSEHEIRIPCEIRIRGSVAEFKD